MPRELYGGALFGMISTFDSCPRCEVKLFQTLNAYGDLGYRYTCCSDCPISFSYFSEGYVAIGLVIKTTQEKYFIYLDRDDVITIRSSNSYDILSQFPFPDDFSFDQKYLESLVRLAIAFQ